MPDLSMTGAPRSLAVIGGTGFFGKSFLDAFRRGLLAPWRIERLIAVARHPDTLRREHPDLVGPGVELVASDVASTAAIPPADIIVHAANTTDARRYIDDPLGERAAILAAADNFARRVTTDCPAARIVYTSSGAVYGQQAANVAGLDEGAPFAGADGLTAYKRDYAEAKRAAEAAVARLGSTHGVCVSVARCFSFVGPYLPRDQHFAIGNFLADALAGRPITVNARHPVIRSYMHADDLVRWLMQIADQASPACPVYNVGSDEAVSIADLARRVGLRRGVAVHLPEQVDSPVDRYVPAVGRAARELDLRLTFNLDRAIDATIARLEPDALVRAGDSATSHDRNAVTSSSC
jgi:nucleoside-diphosphate-sugar epimerase